MFNHDDMGHIMGKPSSKVAQKQVDENITIVGQIAFLESRGSKDTVNPYEMRRNKIVAEIKAKMRALGLGISQSDGQKEKKKTKRGWMQLLLQVKVITSLVMIMISLNNKVMMMILSLQRYVL